MTMTRGLALALALAYLPAAAAEWRGAPRVAAIVEEAIGEGIIPGAVVLVGRGARILHHQAYGARALLPQKAPARLDTMYDCASLTKVVATTPVILSLVEEGKLRLGGRVTEYLPEFTGGRSRITLRQLLTHSSGLRPDLDLVPEWEGYETALRMAYAETSVASPGKKFIYSDINFILLAEIARRVGGKPLDELAAERIFRPLAMKDSMFRPPVELRGRIAPTLNLRGVGLLQGVVHDPTTRYMGGVSGHAGLFSTAADLGRFCRMMLGRGRLGAARVLSPLAIAAMTRRQTPPELPARGLGWDIDSRFASLRGDLYPPGSYGHTGYTGTSIWIDPSTDSYVVVMTNRVHPTDSGSVVSLRARISSVVAATMDDAPPAAARNKAAAPRRVTGDVLSGLDVLVRDGFAPLAGKRVGLITNHTGLDRFGRRNVDLFAAADNVELGAIFAPEHGFAGALDQEMISDAADAATGVPVYSLYQPGRRRPTPKMLTGLDALVFDIQGVGARFYTYSTTMAYAMEEAAKAGVEFWVLDRPNPITGVVVEGPPLDAEHQSFIGYLPVPVRHGMTLGELARLHNEEVGADLHVVRMEGWRREMWFDETGLPWTNPSPNIRTLNQALLYPGVALLEGLTNYSVGRGTDAPFEFVGADWIDGPELAREINARGIEGVRAYAVRRRPDSSRFKGRTIEGVQLIVADRDRFSSLRLGLELASALARLYPREIQWEQTARLVGRQATLDAWGRGETAASVWDQWSRSAKRFERERGRFLLYK